MSVDNDLIGLIRYLAKDDPEAAVHRLLPRNSDDAEGLRAKLAEWGQLVERGNGRMPRAEMMAPMQQLTANAAHKRGDLDLVKSLHADMAAMAAATPPGGYLRRALASAAAVLVYDFGEKDDIAAAEAIYKGLLTLSRVFPADADVAGSVAQSSICLITDHGKRSDVDKVRELCNDLFHLFEAHGDHDLVRTMLGRGSLVLILMLVDAQIVREAQWVAFHLKDLLLSPEFVEYLKEAMDPEGADLHLDLVKTLVDNYQPAGQN